MEFKRRRDRAVFDAGGAAHTGPKARYSPEIRQRIQKLRKERWTGIRTSKFAINRDDVCSTARALRIARGPRILRSQRALRFLRHSRAGYPAGTSHC